MKKTLITILILLLIAGVAVVSCPDKAAHKEAIMIVVKEKINETMSENASVDDKELAFLSASFGSGLVGVFLDSRLTVKNNFVYSIGEVTLIDGTVKKISIGVFGHVFTFCKKDLDEAMEGVF